MKVDISVIICTYNRCESLKLTLDSLLKLKGNGHFSWEIIVVDNNSKDQTKTVVEEYGSLFQGKLRYVLETEQGIASARNAGIKQAGGSIVAFTDDDCLIDSSWLLNIFELFDTQPCVAMGGRILPIFPDGTPRWIKDYQDLLNGPMVIHDYGEAIKPYQRPMFPMVGANIAYRRNIFDRVGLFRPELGAGRGTMGEETEMFSRLMRYEQPVYYCGKALIWHKAHVGRLNLKYIGRWNIALGRYRFLIDEKGQVDPSLPHLFGVPRYLCRDMMENIFLLIGNVFNRREFIKQWILLCRTWGKVCEIRDIRLKESLAS